MNPETVTERSLIVSTATEEEIHLLADSFQELFKVQAHSEVLHLSTSLMYLYFTSVFPFSSISVHHAALWFYTQHCSCDETFGWSSLYFA